MPDVGARADPTVPVLHQIAYERRIPDLVIRIVVFPRVSSYMNLPFSSSNILLHNFKARVETLPGPKTRYSVKAWNAREEEPADWDLVGIDGAQDLQSGSLLLVVHHSDVTFGNVEVRSLAPPGP